MGILGVFQGVNKKELFLVILLFLLAFGIRGHNLKYEYFFEFDTYFHARMTEYWLINGTLPDKDPSAYYQLGGSSIPVTGPFFWYFSGTIYKLATLGAPYNKESWIFFVKLLPAIYGAITAVAMYFFLKNTFVTGEGKMAGYTAAIIAATIPAYVYRTMAGFFEDDSFGFMWMVLGFWFFAKALREPKLDKGHAINAVLAGVFFGLMAWAWQFFLVVPIILFLYFVFVLVKFYAQRTFEEFKALVVLFLISFILLILFGWTKDPRWVKDALEIAVNAMALGSIGWTIVIGVILLGVVLLVGLFWLKRQHAQETPMLNLALTAVLYIGVLTLAIVFTDPGAMFERAFRPDTVLSQTIGEESKGLNAFGEKFGVMIVLPILALLLIPWRIYRKKEEHLSLMLFFWIMITFFMAYYKLQYTFTFGLPIAAAGAVVAVELFDFFKNRKGLEVKFAAFGLSIILLSSIAAGSIFVLKQPPSIETWDGWKEGLHWIRDNTPKDAKMFNWWDEGHWISFIGERKVFLDNRNFHSEGDQEFAQFVTTTDLNHALGILRKNKPDYIIFDRDLFGSQGSLLQYAYWTTHLDQVPELGPKISGYYGAAMRCQQQGLNYTCEGNLLTAEQMNSVPAIWTSMPTQIRDGRTPEWYYRNTNNSAIFVVGNTLNDSILSRMWFHEPMVGAYVEEVYQNSRLKIFKVKESVYEEN